MFSTKSNISRNRNEKENDVGLHQSTAPSAQRNDKSVLSFCMGNLSQRSYILRKNREFQMINPMRYQFKLKDYSSFQVKQESKTQLGSKVPNLYHNSSASMLQMFKTQYSFLNLDQMSFDSSNGQQMYETGSLHNNFENQAAMSRNMTSLSTHRVNNDNSNQSSFINDLKDTSFLKIPQTFRGSPNRRIPLTTKNSLNFDLDEQSQPNFESHRSFYDVRDKTSLQIIEAQQRKIEELTTKQKALEKENELIKNQFLQLKVELARIKLTQNDAPNIRSSQMETIEMNSQFKKSEHIQMEPENKLTKIQNMESSQQVSGFVKVDQDESFSQSSSDVEEVFIIPNKQLTKKRRKSYELDSVKNYVQELMQGYRQMNTEFSQNSGKLLHRTKTMAANHNENKDAQLRKSLQRLLQYMGIHDPNIDKHDVKDLEHMREYILQMIIYQNDLLHGVDLHETSHRDSHCDKDTLSQDSGTNYIRKEYQKQRFKRNLKKAVKTKIKQSRKSKADQMMKIRKLMEQKIGEKMHKASLALKIKDCLDVEIVQQFQDMHENKQIKQEVSNISSKTKIERSECKTGMLSDTSQQPIFNPPAFPEVLRAKLPATLPNPLPREIIVLPPKCPPRPKEKPVDPVSLMNVDQMPRAYTPRKSQIPAPPTLSQLLPPLPTHNLPSRVETIDSNEPIFLKTFVEKRKAQTVLQQTDKTQMTDFMKRNMTVILQIRGALQAGTPRVQDQNSKVEQPKRISEIQRGFTANIQPNYTQQDGENSSEEEEDEDSDYDPNRF